VRGFGHWDGFHALGSTICAMKPQYQVLASVADDNLLLCRPHFRPPPLRRPYNRRSSRSRQNALLYTSYFALRRMAQCFRGGSYSAQLVIT
jgi:hypothetical protein